MPESNRVGERRRVKCHLRKGDGSAKERSLEWYVRVGVHDENSI